MNEQSFNDNDPLMNERSFNERTILLNERSLWTNDLTEWTTFLTNERFS